MLSRALPRDQRSELRELNQREAARWLTGPPEARVPVRIVRRMIAEAERGPPELTLEQHGRPALVVRARHEDRGTETAGLHELRDALRVLLRGRRGAFHNDRGRGHTGRDGGAFHELGRGYRRGVARPARKDEHPCVALFPERDRGLHPGPGVTRYRDDGVGLREWIGEIEPVADSDENGNDGDRAHEKTEEKTSHRDRGCRTGAGRSVRGYRIRRGASCLEAFGAIDGSVRPRREGNLAGAATVRAHDVVHALSSGRGALGLGASPAIGAALRLMEQALLRVKLLLAGGPHEGIPALAADQVLVGQRHRHSRAPPAESYAESLRVAQQGAFRGGGEPESGRERGPWSPECVAHGLRGIDTATHYLGRSSRRAPDAGWRSEDRRERGYERVHARRDAGAYVVDAGVLSGERGKDRFDDIGDVHVVAFVAAVAE